MPSNLHIMLYMYCWVQWLLVMILSLIHKRSFFLVFQSQLFVDNSLLNFSTMAFLSLLALALCLDVQCAIVRISIT